MYAVSNEVQPHKSISRSRTLDKPTHHSRTLRSHLVLNLSHLTMRLRRYDMAARKIGVFLRDNQFSTTGDKVRLPRPMRIDEELLPYVQALFNQCYRSGTTYRLTGIVLAELTPHNAIQPSLFEDVERLEKQHNMASATDMINTKFGRGAIARASSKVTHDDLIVCSFKKGSDLVNQEL